MNREVIQKRASLFGQQFYQVWIDGRPTLSRLTEFTEDELRSVARIGPSTDPLAVHHERPRQNTVLPTRPLLRRDRWADPSQTDIARTFAAARWRMAKDGVEPKLVERCILIVDNVGAAR